MPKRRAIERAKRDKEKGKSPSTQAGEFVREEVRKYEEGEGAGSRRQAIAIGLSEARRAGVDLPPPKDNGRDVRKRCRAGPRGGGRARRGLTGGA